MNFKSNDHTALSVSSPVSRHGSSCKILAHYEYHVPIHINIWYQMTPIVEDRMESLKEFIGQLFEPSVNPALRIEDKPIPVDLRTRYKHAMAKFPSLCS